MSTKREKMRQIKAAQKLALKLEEENRPLNPNYKKGRRTYSEIFAGINTKSKKSTADY
jgi:hypothetical protein